MHKAYINKINNKLQKVFGHQSAEKIMVAIISEREYQDNIWNENTTSTNGKHTHIEFYLFMISYLNEAIDILSRNPEPKASNEAAHILRKIAAMAVASSEQNTQLKDAFSTHHKSPLEAKNINESVAFLSHIISKALSSNYNQCNTNSQSQMEIILCCSQGMHSNEIYPIREG